MDVFTLLDELEEIVDRGAKIPMTGKVLVDDEAIFDIIDKVRSTLPEELRQAKWVMKERDRIQEEAQAEATKMVEQGRNYIAKLVDEAEVTKQAQAQAEEVVAQAKRVGREIRSGANVYADELLVTVEKSLIQLVETLRKDREELSKSITEQK
ncbi:MAG TPA: hypothetical protein VFF14_09275 [Candidatus Deferrimicrobium sp.]|nr:hypothetical protein [Candidatus Deferrimicrobium sp.]